MITRRAGQSTWIVPIVAIVGGLAARPLAAQDLARVDTADLSVASIRLDDPPSESAARRFVVDVAHDYRNFLSVETALWLGIGGGAALAVHPADEALNEAASNPNAISLPGGSVYGSQYFQIPAAIAWWGLGTAAGSKRHAETGRDLLRAQIAAGSWTYAIKLVAQRTRPNGEPHSFPSGHASASFATAAVLQDHYGWKAGLPAFMLATYTAASRVADNRHWASDVVFGAALGVACGRTITITYRKTKLSVAPVAVPGGGAIIFTAVH